MNQSVSWCRGRLGAVARVDKGSKIRSEQGRDVQVLTHQATRDPKGGGRTFKSSPKLDEQSLGVLMTVLITSKYTAHCDLDLE